jgi:hypothetical protein
MSDELESKRQEVEEKKKRVEKHYSAAKARTLDQELLHLQSAQLDLLTAMLEKIGKQMFAKW